MFILHKVYPFRISRKQTWNGADYFVLRYKGKETMRGYEHLCFRTRVLPFQQDWEQDDYDTRVLMCYVQDFNRIGNVPTEFPVLVQVISTLLQEHYVIGQEYTFSVEVPQGTLMDNGEVLAKNILRDHYGIKHYLPHEGKRYSVGERIQLEIKDIGPVCLKFVHPDVATIAKTFNVGEQYDFEVVKIEENNLTVKDNIVGILHRYRASGRNKHTMGSMIQLKVRNIVNGRLSLAPSKTQSIADIAAKVETIESDHIGEEGQTVEYKSSFVFTCDGIADIEKQLGQEIMRQVAAFMNCNGGTIYIGYRDDGTVCGIEKDLEFINDDTSDRFNPYKLTIDGITLKFQNTISRVLGSLASRNVSVRVKKDERSGKLICKLVVTPRSQLVWLNGRRLFIRCQNTVQELYGDEIIQFYEERQREWK